MRKKKTFLFNFRPRFKQHYEKTPLYLRSKRMTNNCVLFWNTWPDVFALFMGVLTVPTLTRCFTSRNSSTRSCKLLFVFGTPDNRISTISLHIKVFHDTPVLLFSQMRLVCIFFFLRTLSHYNLFFLTDLHKIQYLRFLNWHLCGCTKQVAYLLVAWHLTYCSTTVCFKILLVKFVIAGMLWWRVYVKIFEGFPDSKSSYSRNNKHPTMPALFSLSKKNISECQVCSGYALKIQF